MPEETEQAVSAESQSFEVTEVGAVEDVLGTPSPPPPEPIPITVKVGDVVKISGTVTSVDEDAVTIEIDDGLDCPHRVTISGRQASVALS